VVASFAFSFVGSAILLKLTEAPTRGTSGTQAKGVAAGSDPSCKSCLKASENALPTGPAINLSR